MSCALCRLSHSSCDKNQPCWRCVRMNLAHQCFRPPPAKKGRPPRASTAPAVPILPLRPADSSPPPPTSPPVSSITPPPQKFLNSTPTIAPIPLGRPPLQDEGAWRNRASTSPTPTVSAPPTPPVATSFLIETIMEMKNELRDLRAEVGKVKTMKATMREMNKRLKHLEDENSRLNSSRMTPQHGPSLKKRRRSDDDGSEDCDSSALMEEMLWCFPFLARFNITPGRFVVDDLQKAILALATPMAAEWNEMTMFANPQFCDVSGFSLPELLDRKLVCVMPKAEKARTIRAFMAGSLAGVSEVVECCFQFEHKQGYLVKIAARCQFFIDTAAQMNYSVTCIDQVLGSELLLESLDEVRAKEEAEWDEILCHYTPTQAANGSAPSTHSVPSPASWHDLMNHCLKEDSSLLANSPQAEAGLWL